MGKSYISTSTGKTALMSMMPFPGIHFYVVLWLIYIDQFIEISELYSINSRVTHRDIYTAVLIVTGI